ncbi:hypothetical protein BX600DRAFT_482022 [Xylariales sp. PMI_506]|nr:hypothetical protein BX600DRAFT_482022 [Xylariales sp. PMI_506]
MSKAKKAAAKRKRQNEAAQPVANKKRAADHAPTPPTSDLSDAAEPTSIGALVSPEEMEITMDTLRSLTDHPAVIKTKACRDLRTAVYNFRQACTTGVNSSSGDMNLTARISASLVDERYVDALVLLAEMRLRGEVPKLGALCRWVRDLDVTSGLSTAVDGSGKVVPRSEAQFVKLRVLDAVARVTGTMDLQQNSGLVPWSRSSGPIVFKDLWDLRGADATPFPARASVLDGSIFTACPPGLKENVNILETTPGPQRKPPNLHDAVLYLTNDDAVPLSATPPPITHHHHPAVPKLSLMRGVLSHDECKAIIAATETIGFLPDAPLRDDGAAASVLAHNVYWIVDQAFHDKLWERVSPFIPAEADGRRARGINRRFRVYRYVPGAEYRCHFDGAWPPSGVDPVSGKYLWDSSPADAKQSSLYTFLVYLNDEFEGGETTFVTPSPVEGVMNAHPVRPVMGSIALFPHGETKGALLHEGTGVRKGAKYIIRTDVEYDVVPGRVA